MACLRSEQAETSSLQSQPRLKGQIKFWYVSFHLPLGGGRQLLPDDCLDPQRSNDIYRLKDVVEKAFNKLKPSLSLKRIIVQSVIGCKINFLLDS
jgi:transposase